MSAEFAQPALNQLIHQHLPRTFPALSLCVIHQGDIRLQKAWGWIDPDSRNVQVTAETRFDLASVSKLIIETCFLILVERGDISLDSQLVEVLPEFASLSPRAIGSGQDPHSRKFLPIDDALRGHFVEPAHVSFRHLLTHSSGLPAWRAVYLLAADGPPPTPSSGQRHSEERWRRALEEIVSFPFVCPIGETPLYSDIGIMLLGEAVSRLVGAPLDSAVRELVLTPLNLASFTYNPIQNGLPRDLIAPTENDDHWRFRRAWGEVHDENACGIGGVAGHAGLFATALDVARFGQAWLAGDPRLAIGEGLRAAATSLQINGEQPLGLGWMLKSGSDSSAGDRFSADSFGHTGFTGTSLWIDPSRQLVCAVLTNRVYHGRDPQGIQAFRRAIHDIIAVTADTL